MNPRTLLGLTLLAALAAPAPHALAAQDKDAACIRCHEKFVTGKSAHLAPKAGCAACHAVTDGNVTPHRSSSALPKAVLASGDALCKTCHDTDGFRGPKKHRAMSSGCGYCHDPHASKHESLLTMPKTELCLDCHDDREDIRPDMKVRHKASRDGCTYCHAAHSGSRANLLTMEMPALCLDCHDEDGFGKKARHKPVREGKCLDCHSPHGSQHAALLLKPDTQACLECHKDVRKTPHAVAGFTTGGHPVGGEKPGLMDPLRPKRPFDCFSCHEPHDAPAAGLLRVDAAKPNVFCQQCHKI